MMNGFLLAESGAAISGPRFAGEKIMDIRLFRIVPEGVGGGGYFILFPLLNFPPLQEEAKS